LSEATSRGISWNKLKSPTTSPGVDVAAVVKDPATIVEEIAQHREG